MNYLAKKVGENYIAWFEASNQWVSFDTPQWFTFKLLEKQTSVSDTAVKVSEIFKLSPEKGLELAENINLSIEVLTKPSFETPNLTLYIEKVASYKLEKKKSRTYIYNENKVFRIIYGSANLEKYIHSALSHLETKEKIDAELVVEVFAFEDRFFLRTNGLEEECLSTEEMGQIKHQLYVKLAGFLFNKKMADWLAIIHASAVEKKGKAVVLTSAGGSGKSTLAGLLCTSGFRFVSDDFVPVSLKSLKVFPFPAALSIKGDSIELLKSKGLDLQSDSKNIAYSVLGEQNKFSGALPVRAIIFVQYNTSVECVFQRLPLYQALPILFKEIWTGGDMKNAKRFLGWFLNQKFYRLEYSDNFKAIKALNELMAING